MFLLSTLGCVEFFAVQMAPERVPERSTTAESQAVKDAFWTAFRDNDVASIPKVTADLTAEYLAHPQDASLARLLGHVHFWTFVERDRLGELDATITDEVILSEHYFRQAALLEPDDHRMHAWWGGDRLVIGELRKDEAETRRGYFEVKRGIDSYPAFNLVTAGFVFGLPPKDAPPFAEGLEALWQALDQCAGTPVDRDALDVTPIVTRDPLPARDAGEVCWNDPQRYPFNQQGILLQLAELLIKNGEPARAQQVLAQLETTPDYARWPLRSMAEDRVANAAAYAAAWDAGEEPPFLLTSGHSCTVCHAAQATPTPAAPEPPPEE